VLQLGDARADIALALQSIDLLLQDIPLARQRLDLTGLLSGLAELIKQAQLFSAFEQVLLVMLSVDFQQQGSEFRQLRECGVAAIDPGFGTAIGTDDPA
jgi:hypothetical protein